ncbi:hypothetical protein GE061_004309, partial [Apolygus lucorum]
MGKTLRLIKDSVRDFPTSLLVNSTTPLTSPARAFSAITNLRKKMDLLNQLQAIDNEVESNVRTISVKELPLEEPFMIQDIRKVSTRFGQTVVARLKSRVTGRCEDVWLPRRYGETFIKSKEKYKVNSLSMMYHGIENSSNAFRLTFEMTPEDYNEADNEGDGNNTDSEEEQEFNPTTSATTSSK